MEYPPNNKTVNPNAAPRNRQHELLWYYQQQQQQQLYTPQRPMAPQATFPSYVDLNAHWAMDNHAAMSAQAAPSRDNKMSMSIMKRERLVKFKTELCKNYTNKQVCPFYTSCSFAHGEGERRRNPVTPFAVDYRPELCKDGTKDNNYCLNNNELYYHPENYKTQYCKSAQTGEACTRPLCAMAHSATELKSKPNTNTLAYLARYQVWDKIREKLDQNPQDQSLISSTQAYQFTRETALHYCAKYGQVDLCRRLILLGADVNSKDWKEQTPLHKLCAFGGGEDIATAKLLLEMGANKASLDSDGSTPSNFAAKANHTQLLTLLTSWNDGQFVEEKPLSPGNDPKDSPQSAKADNLDANEDLEPPLKRIKTEHIYQQIPEPKSDGSTQIKIKHENKLKLLKLTPNCNLASLHAQIKGKLSLNPPYYLTYFDPEGDNITIEDEDDLALFLGASNPKKLLEVNMGTASQQADHAEEDSASQGEIVG